MGSVRKGAVCLDEEVVRRVMELLKVCRVLLNVGVREEVSIMVDYVSVIFYFCSDCWVCRWCLTRCS